MEQALINLTETIQRLNSYLEERDKDYDRLKKKYDRLLLQMNAANEKLYSQHDAAKMIGISDASLYKKRLDGSITSVFIGKRWMYRLSDIMSFKNSFVSEKRNAVAPTALNEGSL